MATEKEEYTLQINLSHYHRMSFKKGVKRYWMLYAMLLIPIAQYVIFRYCPLWGVQIAFRDYNIIKGLSASKRAGFKYFN